MVVVIYLLFRFGSAVVLVLLVGLAVGALPGVSGTRPIGTGIEVCDLAIVAMIVALIAINFQQGFKGFQAHAVAMLARLSAMLLTWWLIIFARTALSTTTTTLQAARTGRYWIYLALLARLFASALTDRGLRVRFVQGLGLLAGVTAAAECAASAGVGSIALLVHPGKAFIQKGVPSLERIYTGSSDTLIPAAYAFALGGSILLRERRLRTACIAVACISGLDIVLSLGRAKYLGIALATIAVVTLWSRVSGVKWRVARSFLALLTVVALLVVAAPSSPPAEALNQVGARLTSTFADLSDQNTATNTIAYRLRVSSIMEQQLSARGDWLTGFGFLSATSSFDPDLPLGSLYNSDLGVLSAIMLMGLVGAVLIYLPVMWTCAVAIRARWHPVDRDSWLMFGALLYSIYALVTSRSLIVLYGSTGVLTTAAVLGVGIAAAGSLGHDSSRHDHWSAIA